jgi:ABC-type multidrug transport system fused ATPase/permease subunit
LHGTSAGHRGSCHMADARRTYVEQVKEFFPDIAFILTLAWKEHKSLVVDEPSAALDTEAEEVFFEQLLREIQDKSIMFISHRFSTVRRADQILSLRRGRVNEYGTHEELTQRNGRYAELFRMQARWYG